MVALSNPCLLDPTLAPEGKLTVHLYCAGNEPFEIWEASMTKHLSSLILTFMGDWEDGAPIVVGSSTLIFQVVTGRAKEGTCCV
eukprot:4418127-Amphidinium_carterae.1